MSVKGITQQKDRLKTPREWEWMSETEVVDVVPICMYQCLGFDVAG